MLIVFLGYSCSNLHGLFIEQVAKRLKYPFLHWDLVVCQDLIETVAKI